MKNKPIPKNIKEIRGFLGLCGYYRRFVPNYSKIAYPLTELTKKNNKFKWTPACQIAFDTLINQIINPPCLIYPDYSKPFIVTTDASSDGIGAVLSQVIDDVEKPVAFYSRKLSNTEKKYPPYDLEGLAIKLALQKWRYYLLDHKILVRTDNQPIIGILKKRDCDGRLAKYLSVIQEYNVEFQYLPGSKNVVADYLSRSWNEAGEIQIDYNKTKLNHNVAQISIVKKNKNFDIHQFKSAQEEDENIQNLVNKQNSTFEYIKLDEIWYSKHIKKNKLKILVPQSYINFFLNHFHVELCSHQGITKTYQRLMQVCYWPNMRTHVGKFINNCSICKCAKPDHRANHKMGTFPLPEYPFHTIHVDLLGPLPNGRYKNKYICVIVDSFSRFVITKPITKKTPEKIIQIIRDEIINKQQCIPKLLVCDEGGEFIAQKFTDFCNNYNIDIHHTSPYHHSSNGTVERMNYSIENLLRCALLQNKGNWVDHVSNISRALNSAIHPCTGFAPLQILGHKISTGIAPIDDNIINSINENYQVIIKNIRSYQQKIHSKLNKNRREIKYRVGDIVYAKVSNLVGKLKPIYQGPGHIEKMDKFSCFVKFENGTIRRVHVNHLK